MATKRLARELGLIQTCKNSEKISIKTCPKQEFDYLLVLDFESTCWKDNKSIPPEVIEFPVVLLDLKSGQILDQFRQHVFPTEQATLSKFCTELTGITQAEVENGVPLTTSIGLFAKWLSKLSVKYEFSLQSKSLKKLATFATWSDWDLGTCLNFECRRKNIKKPDYFNRWIDVRLTYKNFYKRIPEGLNGALHDLGLKFEGREHSGICDATNTAYLINRMVQDGCLFQVTKVIT